MRFAEVCTRYAALLVAGVGSQEIDRQLAGQISKLDDEPRTRLERAIAYGRNLGVPLAELLGGMAANANHFEQRQRELRSAFAAPSATAKIVTGLPLLSHGTACRFESVAGLGNQAARAAFGRLWRAVVSPRLVCNATTHCRRDS